MTFLFLLQLIVQIFITFLSGDVPMSRFMIVFGIALALCTCLSLSAQAETIFFDDFEDNAAIDGGASRLGDTLGSAAKFGPGPPAVVGSWSSGNYGAGGTYRVKNADPAAAGGSQWGEVDRIGDPRLLAVFNGGAQATGTQLRFESMVYIKNGGDEANIGFQGTTNKDDFALFISGRRNGSMQYWDTDSGWTDATTGGGNPMTYAQDTWQKWGWDYTVGDANFTFSVDGVQSDPVDVKDPSTLPKMVTFSMNSNIGPGFGIDNTSVTVVPEPSTFVILTLGLLGCLGLARRSS